MKEYYLTKTTNSIADTRVNIYVNPEREELKQCQSTQDKSIRFIARSDTKRIYVFSGDCLHEDAALTLDIDYDKTNTVCYFGLGKLRGSKIVSYYNTFMEYSSGVFSKKGDKAKYIKAIMAQDWNWLYEYVADKEFDEYNRAKLLLAKEGR
jgi:hypothetical protein